ncbi:hypothetical protein [Spirosoma spitsbergense]|jgi:hypothetical protein|uniref:hypothetical protein n=1 Tax=Spirosoma spitsbergense TaxID=431554 RepID=UPI00037C3B42|nr:hypothetical protein [Spirosoma spitsbergense]
MKTIKPIAIFCLLAFTLSSCATNMKFLTSAIVPAATGEVKVKKDNNNNYVLNLDVKNLAEPKSLTPPHEAYVVWMEDGRNAVKKLGQLSPGSGMLSSSLKASLTATSVTEPTRVFITAEEGVDRQVPEGQIILTTK